MFPCLTIKVPLVPINSRAHHFALINLERRRARTKMKNITLFFHKIRVICSTVATPKADANTNNKTIMIAAYETWRITFLRLGSVSARIRSPFAAALHQFLSLDTITSFDKYWRTNFQFPVT